LYAELGGFQTPDSWQIDDKPPASFAKKRLGICIFLGYTRIKGFNAFEKPDFEAFSPLKKSKVIFLIFCARQ
jgi:hypothetical protein